jgi:hypothetical protein
MRTVKEMRDLSAHEMGIAQGVLILDHLLACRPTRKSHSQPSNPTRESPWPESPLVAVGTFLFHRPFSDVRSVIPPPTTNVGKNAGEKEPSYTALGM